MDQKLNDKKHAPGSGKRNFVEDACMQIRPVLGASEEVMSDKLSQDMLYGSAWVPCFAC